MTVKVNTINIMFRVTKVCLQAVKDGIKKDDVYNKFIGRGMVYKKMISKPSSVFVGGGHVGVALDGGIKEYYCIKLDNGYKINTNNYVGKIGPDKMIYKHKEEYADHLINYSTKEKEASIAGPIMSIVAATVLFVILVT